MTFQKDLEYQGRIQRSPFENDMSRNHLKSDDYYESNI